MGTPIHLTPDNFQNEIAIGYTLVDFWAAWCGPCKMIAPVIEELAEERTDVKIAKLDVDAEGNGAIAGQFGVQGIPTLGLFKDGELVDRLVGAGPKASIVSFIEDTIAA